LAQITSLSSQSSIYSLVSNILALERQPITTLESKRADLRTLDAVFGDLRSTLLSLRSAAQGLAETVNSPLSARAVVSSDSSVVTASATASAALGSHTVFVSRLAKHHTMVSDRFTSAGDSIRTALGTGDFTFRVTVNGTSTDVTVTIGEDDTDEEIIAAAAAAINSAMADVEDAVSATALKDTSTTTKLVIRSNETGSTYKMALEDISGALLSTLGIDDEDVAATDTTGGYVYADSELDALLNVDGIPVTRDSNVLDDVISGITLTLRGAQSAGADPVSLTVRPDQESIRSVVEDFIEKFNDALEYLRNKTAVDATTGTRQALGGQYLYLNLLASLRTAVVGAVSTGSEDIKMLADIGITAAADGSLSITDADAFAAALESDPAAFSALFNADGGIAKGLDALLQPFVSTGGYLDAERSNLDRRVATIDERIQRLEQRMDIRERELIEQYSKLQEALALLSSQQNYLGVYLGLYTS